jgi:hypothetical protein
MRRAIAANMPAALRLAENQPNTRERHEMKRQIAFIGALALAATLSGSAYAQFGGGGNLGNTGLGDARAKDLPTSQGINNGYENGAYFGGAGAPPRPVRALNAPAQSFERGPEYGYGYGYGGPAYGGPAYGGPGYGGAAYAAPGVVYAERGRYAGRSAYVVRHRHWRHHHRHW